MLKLDQNVQLFQAQTETGLPVGRVIRVTTYSFTAFAQAFFFTLALCSAVDRNVAVVCMALCSLADAGKTDFFFLKGGVLIFIDQ